MEHGSDDTLRRYLREFDDQPIPTGIPSSLPLLDDLLREHPFHEVFAGVDTLFIQHHLAPLVPRVQGMVREGLDLSRCWFVDVPYSTNDRARQGLTGLGHPKAQRTEPFDDPLEAYAESQMARVERILEEIADRDSPRRLLVLDDGAYFSRSLARLLERRSIPALSMSATTPTVSSRTT